MNKLSAFIAYRLPRRVIYWCIVRVFAFVSTQTYPGKAAGEITLFDAVEAYK